jgi:hypothetical protein
VKGAAGKFLQSLRAYGLRGLFHFSADLTITPPAHTSEEPANDAAVAPTVWNNNIGIIQTKDNVAIQSEMIHVVRSTRINGMHETLPLMYGDSIGHWKGATLVVDTINVHGQINYRNNAIICTSWNGSRAPLTTRSITASPCPIV